MFKIIGKTEKSQQQVQVNPEGDTTKNARRMSLHLKMTSFLETAPVISAGLMDEEVMFC